MGEHAFYNPQPAIDKALKVAEQLELQYPNNKTFVQDSKLKMAALDLKSNWSGLSEEQKSDFFNKIINTDIQRLWAFGVEALPTDSTWTASRFWLDSSKNKSARISRALNVLNRLVGETVSDPTGTQSTKVTPEEYKGALKTLENNWSSVDDPEQQRIIKLSNSIFPKVANFAFYAKHRPVDAIFTEQKFSDNVNQVTLRDALKTILNVTNASTKPSTKLGTAEQNICTLWDRIPEPELELLKEKGYVYNADNKTLEIEGRKYTSKYASES